MLVMRWRVGDVLVMCLGCVGDVLVVFGGVW
jgi:hypothetical protein